MLDAECQEPRSREIPAQRLERMHGTLVAVEILMARGQAGLGFSLFVASIFILGGIGQLVRARRFARDYTAEQRTEMFSTAWRSDAMARRPGRSAVSGCIAVVLGTFIVVLAVVRAS